MLVRDCGAWFDLAPDLSRVLSGFCRAEPADSVPAEGQSNCRIS